MSDTPDVICRENIEELIAACANDVRVAGTAKAAALREYSDLNRRLAEAAKTMEAAESKLDALCRKWTTLQEMASLFALEDQSR